MRENCARVSIASVFLLLFAFSLASIAPVAKARPLLQSAARSWHSGEVVPQSISMARVSPGRVKAAGSARLVITGTGFKNGSVVSILNGGSVDPSITISSIRVKSSTRMLVFISVASNAPLGPRKVVVSHPRKGEAAFDEAFQVVPPGCSGAVDFTPVTTADGWVIAQPEQEHVDSCRLSAMYDFVDSDPRFATAYSLLVIRNGHLIAEGYFNGYTRDRISNLRSATKSITSLLVGIALDRGLIRGTDQRIEELLPEFFVSEGDARKRAMTLRDVLTMRTGLEWDEGYPAFRDFFDMQYAPDSLRFVLSKRMATNPGNYFSYNTGASQILSAILQKVTGRTTYDFARENLFIPLGITDTDWFMHRDGIYYGGVGLHLKPRDMARIGQLCLQKGRWNGVQLVSEHWIEESTRDHCGQPGYGYQWWIPRNAFTASGYGGQYIFVIPDRNIVVVFTANSDTSAHIGGETFEMLVNEYLLTALTD